jgi:hypothetical protein
MTKPDGMINQMLQQYKAAFGQGMEQSLNKQIAARGADPAKYQDAVHRFENQLFGLLAQQLSWQELRPRFAAAYSDTFTLDELRAIDTFYATPAGQAMLQKMPALLQKCSEIGRAQVANTQPEIEKLTADFIRNLNTASNGHP